MFVLNNNTEIFGEKIKSMANIVEETIAKKKKIEKKPLLISFLLVFEEKNLAKAVERPNEARAVISETPMLSCAHMPYLKAPKVLVMIGRRTNPDRFIKI